MTCEHPFETLDFWQYGEETVRTPQRSVRCYECRVCGAIIHDDTPGGGFVPCFHSAHRLLPSERGIALSDKTTE